MEANENSVLTSLGELRRIETNRIEEQERERQRAEQRRREAEQAAERERAEAEERAVREQQARIEREQQQRRQIEQQERIRQIEAERRARVEAELALEQQRIELLRSSQPRRQRAPWLLLVSFAVVFLAVVAVAAYHRGEQIERQGQLEMQRQRNRASSSSPPLQQLPPIDEPDDRVVVRTPEPTPDKRESKIARPNKPPRRGGPRAKVKKPPPKVGLCGNDDPIGCLLKKHSDPFGN